LDMAIAVEGDDNSRSLGFIETDYKYRYMWSYARCSSLSRMIW
jgi:hypothetical protein